MDLTDFLLARIAEDEEWARPASGILGMDVAWHQPDVLHQRGINRADSHHIARWHPARVLAECDAKRRRVKALNDRAPHPNAVPLLRKLLALEALPYADHPDYREEWRP